MILEVIVALATQLVAIEPPVGVAVTLQGGRICVAIPTEVRAPDMTIVLIRPDPPQASMVGSIDREVLECDRLEHALVPGPYYLLGETTAAFSDFGSQWAPWIAISGMLDPGGTDSGNVAVQIGSAYQSVQVRSCTSSEGVHLSVWAGTPLTSERLWHQYYYLGYDVVPSCDALDFP